MSQMKPRRLCRSWVIRSKWAAFSASFVGFSSMHAKPRSVSSQVRPLASDQIARTRSPGSQPAPEVTKLTVAQPPGPFARSAPHIAVGCEMKARHGFIWNAIVALDALPPLFAVGDIESAVGRDPNLPDGVSCDRHNAGTCLDRRLAGLELSGPDLERLVTVARGAKSPAIGHDPHPATGRPSR